MNVKERFLKYVAFHTTSKEDVDTIPSTKKQLILAKYLENELNDLGLSKVRLDKNGYVYALLPATKGKEDVKPLGFISHMDTAPAFSGENVKPQIIENYDGKDVILKGSGTIMETKEFPQLKTLVGRTLITTDGTTLLGADDKAGIAEIITAIEEIIKENLPHGDLWLGFTPDEEVGKGADLFDLDYFKAEYAYTMDGDYEGEIAYQNFNAASATFTVIGKSVHPGSAKDVMINAGTVACEIQSMLPESQTPEHTTGFEGFIMLESMHGSIPSAEMSYILRDHSTEKFEQKQELCKKIAELMNIKYGQGTVSLEIKETYLNMAEIVKDHFEIIELAKEAITSCGLDLVSTPVRGGTDGARLSFMGLPCPNLGTGGDSYHGPYEHITVEGMEHAIQVIKYICSHAS